MTSHPLIQQRNNLAYYFVLWLLIAVFQSLLLRVVLNLNWSFATADSLIFNFSFAVLGLSFWYPCRYISLERNNVFKVLGNHTLTSIIASLIWLGLAFIILTKLVFPKERAYESFFENTFLWRFLIGILFYFILAAFYYLFIYYQNFHERLLRESELKSLVKEAELKSLKFQINPHFIFNSLNSINSLIHTSPTKAATMTVKLGEFLRSTLAKKDIQTNSLREELMIARLYLDIEKVRFGEKINYIENIDNGCLNIEIPNMILQPLFENAVKHGVYESLEPVKIRVTAKLEQDFLKIRVENDYEPSAIPKKGERVGLENISLRFQNMYNKNNLCVVEKEQKTFRVILYIPLGANERNA
jgi:sensor histidine kinase YesM